MVMQNSHIRRDGQCGKEQSLKQIQDVMGVEQRNVPRTLSPEIVHVTLDGDVKKK